MSRDRLQAMLVCISRGLAMCFVKGEIIPIRKHQLYMVHADYSLQEVIDYLDTQRQVKSYSGKIKKG